jgi:UTP-glucose-1-phosphate uridylyltransferase
MLTVVDKPLIQYAVEEAKAAGIEQFYFVTGRAKGDRGSFRRRLRTRGDLARARQE